MKRLGFVLVFLSVGVAAAAGCGDGGSGPAIDAGPVDGTPPPDTGGNPITAPDLVWTWIPFEGTRCMNNTATGLGVNLSPGATKTIIYMEGGGACFNSFTCGGVAHQNGFGEAELAAFAGDLGGVGIFDRADTDNPFRDWNWVFIPYCSGDIFAGDTETGVGGRVQVGYRNFGEYLVRLVPTFSSSTQIVLSGSSAGGFGAAYNFDRTQQAFGSIPVTLLDDSGPPLADAYLTPCLQRQIRDAWNIDATLPPDCTACLAGDGGLVNLPIYLAEKYPDREFGLIQSLEDGVIRLFFGWGYPTCANPTLPMTTTVFAEGLNDLADNVMSSYDNFHVYYLSGSIHVWLFEQPLGSVVVSGVKLTDWIRGLLNDDASWSNVRP